MPARARWFDVVWIILWGGFASAVCVTSASQLGPTFDEPFYVQEGLHHWRSGSTFALLGAGTMPLPVDVETFPLHVWKHWFHQRFNPVEDFDAILPVARAGNLVFLWLLLVYGWRIARRVGGDWGGRLAVVVLACEPNILAHAGLATTDVAIAACLLAFCHHFRAGREGRWWQRVGVPAACYGVAILAKASGLVFAPLCAVVIEFHRLWSERCSEVAFWPKLKQTLAGLFSRQNGRDAIAMGAIAMAIVFIYCGCDFQAKPKFIAWAQAQPDGPGKGTVVWFAEHLKIFNNAGVAILRQVQHNMRGHDGSYLLGEVAPRSFWYYYPVALTIKSPLPLLLLPLGLALIRRKALFNWPCLVAFALLVFSLNCRVQIGVRLQLPLIALAAVGLSAAFANACRGLPVLRLRVGALTACAGVAWMIVSTLSVWPNGLGYVNEAWGGHENGYRLLSDSNYDWGQGLKELAVWQRDHDPGPIDVWYFGTDPAANKAPFHLVPFHALPVTGEDQLRTHLTGRYFAVGTTVLFGSYCPDPAKWDFLESLRHRTPVARTGTFLIFDLSPESSTSGPTRTAAAPAGRLPSSGPGPAKPTTR